MAKKAHIVIAHANTGSGSLTWPEDFTIVGVFLNGEDAMRAQRAFNVAQLKDSGNLSEDDDAADLDDDEIEDVLYGCDDVMIATVEETNLG